MASESTVNVQVLSNALNLFTNAIQAAATNRSSINVTVPQEQAQARTQSSGQTSGVLSARSTFAGSPTAAGLV